MRHRVWAVIALFAAALGACEALRPETESTLRRAPDHVLLWSQDSAIAAQTLSQLGFTIRPGQTYPEGISSSTIVFSDWSYIELLHFSDPSRATGNAQALEELAWAADGPGVNSFAIEAGDIDRAANHLRQRGFSLAPITPDMVDPDGDGPQPAEPASWRDFHFADAPVSGVELFFIEYPSENSSTGGDTPSSERAAHRNQAQRLSAVWVLVPDLEREAAAYERIGFAIGPVLDAPHLNGQVRVATLGSGAVVLAQSPQLPAAFMTPARNGPRVIGLTFEGADTSASSPLRSGPDNAEEFESPLGQALLIQTTPSLGVFLEFQVSTPPAL